jgi:MYXO-CTERM domain-containing protein
MEGFMAYSNARFSQIHRTRTQRIRVLSIAALASAICLASVAQAEIPAGYDVVGPLDVQNRYQRPQVAVYADLGGAQDFHVLAEHTDAQASSYPKYDVRRPLALLRVEDPAEQPLYHRIVDTLVDTAEYPQLAADNLASGVLIDQKLTTTAAGVHVIRMGAGYEFTKLSIGLPPGTAYGISYSNGFWQEWRQTLAPLWVWVPGHAQKPVHVEFRWIAGKANISGVDVAFSASLDSNNTTFVRDLPAGSGEMWKLDGMSADWQFRAGGDVPIIATTTAEFAKKLDASLLTVTTGPFAGERVPHLFQKKMVEEHLPMLMASVGEGSKLTDLIDPALQSTACTTITDPEQARRGIELVGRELPAVAATLDTWVFGSATPNLSAYPGHKEMAPVLAYAASRHHPCNPWGPSAPEMKDGRAELISRATIPLILQMLDITEDERLRIAGDAFDTYPGGLAAFELYYRAKQFSTIAPLLPDYLPSPLGRDLQKALTEAIRRIALDRRYTAYFTSTSNQTAHLVPSITSLNLVPGLPVIPAASKAYSERFAMSASPSGWFEEDGGPDATYNGITHFELADQYLISSWTPACTDQIMRAAIQKSYAYFNATVGPEPNGRILGGFNFSHRTDWGFYDEQYGGAREVARDIPEVAIWSDPIPNLPISDLQTSLANTINLFAQRRMQYANPTTVSTMGFFFQRLLASETFAYPKEHANLSWPAEDPKFDRQFGNDLYAVRRNGYFASIYVGKTNDIGNTAKLNSLPYIRRATPGPECPELYIAHWEDSGMPMPAFKSKPACSTGPSFLPVMPLTGGGITTLWTPSSGVAMMAANWSPIVHHGLVAQGANPMSGVEERVWEDYGSVTLVGANRNNVELSGHLPRYFQAPLGEALAYTRKYTLADDKVDVQVTLTNATANPISFNSIWENLPFPVCDTDCAKHRKGRAIGFFDGNGTPLAAGNQSLDSVRVVDENGHGLAIDFPSAQNMRIRPVGLRQVRYEESIQIGRVELPFAQASIAPGQSQTMNYTIRTLDPIATVPAIVEISDAPQVVCGEAVNGNGGDGGAGGGGVGGSAGSGGTGGAANGDEGCGCRTVSSSAPTSGSIFALLALARAARMRRKSKRN